MHCDKGLVGWQEAFLCGEFMTGLKFHPNRIEELHLHQEYMGPTDSPFWFNFSSSFNIDAGPFSSHSSSVQRTKPC